MIIYTIKNRLIGANSTNFTKIGLLLYKDLIYSLMAVTMTVITLYGEIIEK